MAKRTRMQIEADRNRTPAADGDGFQFYTGREALQAASERWPLTPEAREGAAAALAVACAGGVWGCDFTEAQKDLWRRRVDAALAVEV